MSKSRHMNQVTFQGHRLVSGEARINKDFLILRSLFLHYITVLGVVKKNMKTGGNARKQEYVRIGGYQGKFPNRDNLFRPTA